MSRLINRCCTLAFGAAASVFVLAGPTAADPGYQLAQIYPAYPAYPAAPPPPVFRRHHADAAVRSLGLTPIGPAQPNGPVFIVPAVGREGTQVQVTLDRRSGRVLQITRLGHGGPRIAARQPLPAPGYEPQDEDDYASLDDDELPPEPPHAVPGYSRGPNVVTRDPDITNSIPRGVAPRPVDPLVGVPKEFRGTVPGAREEQQRLAARPPAESIPRSAPLPRPRPADAPSVAQQEPAQPPAASPKPVAKPDPKDVPDVQGFE